MERKNPLATNGVVQEPGVQLGEDGIVRIRFGLHARITRATLQRAEELSRQLTPYPASAPALIVGDGILQVDEDAQHFASDPEIVSTTTACALVPRTFLERFIASLFLRYRKPPYPTRVFETEEDAVQWLKQYVRWPPHTPAGG